MKKRSPAAVLILSIVTIGIYNIYWAVATKSEMNRLGAKIPTALLLIVPFVNIWWIWKHSEGVEYVTKETMSGVLAFILHWLLGFIGQAIIQDSFNKDVSEPTTAPAPEVPVTPAA